MDKLPDPERFAKHAKDARIAAQGAQGQRLHARPAALVAKQAEPRKHTHTPSVPLAPTPKTNRATGPHAGTHREAHGGCAGGGRPLHLHPDLSLVAQAKNCPPCGGVL
jgi:transposase